ncbi:MAG: hypothetical protein CMR00_10180 [[Chlorobium] sp. 445]|nr:MAG: hypothetical protein CMR00_10180 [[Chlorobium] sp. 445]
MKKMRKLLPSLVVIVGIVLSNVIISLNTQKKVAFQEALYKLRQEHRLKVETVSYVLADATSMQPAGTRLTFNDLREYRYSKRDRYPLPEKLKALKGQEVNIAGYMIPMSEALDVTEFMLVQIPFFGCCYSVPPEPNETVMVKMAKGKKTEYVYTPIRVTGKFDIQETKIDGFVVSLYQIEASAVTPAPNDKDVLQHQSGTLLPGRN